MRTFVIAEAGSCHDGDLVKAQNLVRLAAAIGADAVKFQWLSSAEKLCARRNAPEYLAAYKLIEFPKEWLPDLASRCGDNRIEFMCTVYLPEDIEVIAPYVSRFKVASFEAGDADFIAAHFRHNKQVIVSLGMGGTNVGSTCDSAWLAEHYNGLRHLRYLHCVSSYPAPDNQMNLSAIRSDSVDGFSDHSKHPWTGALAVAAGANIVEFHLRLDDTDPANADYAVARTPAEAREYVANIRLAETMLGDGVKRVMPSEEKMLRFRVKA